MSLRHARPCPERRGSALALALMVVTLVAGMGFAFLTLASTVTKRQAADVETVQAFYLAESGLAEAFHAVRSGRSGQIGTAAEPATFGGGLIWVEAHANREGQVELDAQAMFGRARSALRMTVEPVPLDLGFFADEDLVIDSVLLMDGFEGSSQGYVPSGPPAVDPEGGQVVVPRPSPGADYSLAAMTQLHADLVLTLTEPFVARLLSADDGLTFSPDPSNPSQQLIAQYDDLGGQGTEPCLIELVSPALNGQLENLRHAFPELYLTSYTGNDYVYELPEKPLTPEVPVEQTDGVEDPMTDSMSPGGHTAIDDPADSEATDGLLGSNGNVAFQLGVGDSVTLYADVVPGPEGAVTGLSSNVQVTGATTARSSSVDLPPVEVPAIPLQPGIVHSSLLPMTVPPGAVGFESLSIVADAELVLRGPATVVIGELNLADGALLTLDTRNGAVDLYVTGSMHLEQGSDVMTTAEVASDTTIQVSASQSSGDPLVKLEASSRFTGTVYSPRADVLVGSEFEVFGGIVARRLELAPGARLHSARGETGRTPLPELVSWKMLVVPMAPPLAHPDPFRLYGMTRGTAVTLDQAHDLEAVLLDLDYIDVAGLQQQFRGEEADMDWEQVSEVLDAHRTVDFDSLEAAAAAARVAMGADERREEPAALDPADAEHLQGPSDIHPNIRRGVELAVASPTKDSKDEIYKQLYSNYRPITSEERRYLYSLKIGFKPHELDELEGDR